MQQRKTRTLMDQLRQDIRFALRGFRRTPGFFVTAVVILALGIGMSVAMFTVFRTVLVRKLPVVDQDRIAVMWTYRDNPNVETATSAKAVGEFKRDGRTIRGRCGRRALAGDRGGDARRRAHRSRSTAAWRRATSSTCSARGPRSADSSGRATTTRAVTSGIRPAGTRSKVLVLSYAAWQS